MSPSVYLKFQTQVMQIWFLNCRNYHIFAFVKDQGSNLQTCASALTSIVSCNNLGLLEPFDGTCFGHALSKVCQYATKMQKCPLVYPLHL
jgi:hypothetical protein